MIAFETSAAGEGQGSIHAQSRRRRATTAVMTLLLAIVAAALVPANNHASVPSDRFVLACGSSPGPCP
jgi:hypothetical protein